MYFIYNSIGNKIYGGIMFKKIASRLMLVLMLITLTACAGRGDDAKTNDAGKNTKSSESAGKDLSLIHI